MEPDRFAFVAVEQRGVDLLVRVLGPAGDTVMVVDSPNGRWGVEPVLLTDVAPGPYLIEISPLDGEDQAGDFIVTLETSGPVATTPEDRVRQLFLPWDREGSPGASVAITRDGEIVFADGFGEAQIEYGIPITSQTIFHVASVSKQFTAFAIAMLVDLGRISLDDDIREYLPEIPDFGETITIRHLVHHTSGLRDQWNLLSLAGWRMDDVITRDQVLRVMSRQRALNFSPGEELLYCNTGFTLLAIIVTRVTGTPFPEWMTENVFLPLGMTRTHFHEDHQRIVPGRAYSYAEGDEEGLQNAVLSYANVGATSLFTTSEDLARWLVNLDEGIVGGEQVLSLMHNTRAVLNSGDTLGYAMGLSIGEYRGLRTVGHSGGDAGFRTYAVRFPDQALSVNVLGNLGSVNPSDLAFRAAAVYLEDEMVAAEAEPGTTEDEAPEAESPVVDPVTLERYTGAFQLQPGVQVFIRLESRGLVAEGPGLPPVNLLPLSEIRFQVEGNPTWVTFNQNPAGEVESLTLEQQGQEQVAPRVDPFDPGTVTLAEFEGRFYSPELETFYDLAVEEGVLLARHIRHDPITLTATGPDAFSGSIFFFGQAEFDRDEGGRVRSMRVSSGRVRNVVFEKVQW
jgi:CubicO group peptidase (beta-lactamase class C family)